MNASSNKPETNEPETNEPETSKPKTTKEKVEYMYIKYKKKLLSVAMSYMHNRYDSEDAVHDTFLKILTNPNLIDDVDSVQTQALLCIMTKNNCINMIKERQKIEFIEDIPEGAFASNDSIEDNYEHKETLEEVLDEIKSMEDIYKDALMLKYLDDLSIIEIADILGVSYHTAAKRIERGEKLLKNKFGKEVF